MSLPSSTGHDSRQHGKRNYFYDDVMQGIFSIFFSFLLLSSPAFSLGLVDHPSSMMM
jgi:hypothetical protein